MTDERKTADTSKKKKHHPVRTFFIVLICVIALLLLLVAGWCCYATVDKKPSLSVLPAEFAAYIRTDHLWNSANPLVDVKALDVFLADAKYGEARNGVMQFRASEIRKNKWIARAADRRADATFYSDGSFAVALDMGVFSAATRLAPSLHNILKVKGLSYVISDTNEWFQYDAGSMVLFAKPYHNLLLLSSSKKRFDKMCTATCNTEYPAERIDQLSERLNAPFRVACDMNTLLAFDETIDYRVSPYLKPVLVKDALAFVDFGITDSDMHLKLSFPMAELTASHVSSYAAETKLPEQLVSLIVDSSKESELSKMLPDSVQYYTLLNVAPLSQIVDIVKPFIPADKKFDSLWSKGESLCKVLFSLSLEDLLYSWTGNEFAVLGLEGKKDPVFAMQVSNEEQRNTVFKKITSSIVVNENDTLVLNGMRVAQIELPDFLQNILSAFQINVAKPYYYVNKGYVFFSESAENIVQIASADKDMLQKSNTFKSVSTLQDDATSISLYYNLARSVPFFLKSNSSLSQALQLYNIGRADVCLNRERSGEGSLVVLLQAVSREEKSRTSVPGYPLTLDGKTNTQFCKLAVKKPQLLFWVQDEKKIQLYNADTSKSANYDCEENVHIIPFEGTYDGDVTQIPVLWAVTKSGAVLLFDKELKCIPNFPIMLGAGAPVAPALYNGMLLVYTDDGMFHLVKTDGTAVNVTLGDKIKLQSAPTVLGSTVACYSKKLAGTLLVATDIDANGGLTNSSADGSLLSATVHTIPITGISFGSPAILSEKATDGSSSTTIAFVTQSGEFSLYNDVGEPIWSETLKLEKVYYANAVSDGRYFYLVSSDGVLSQIDSQKTMFSIQLQNFTAKHPTLTLYDYDGDGNEEVFVNGDSNVIYGFTNGLDTLKNFPVSGTGAPVFADLDGDNKNECLTISIDGKLNAYKVLKK